MRSNGSPPLRLVRVNHLGPFQLAEASQNAEVILAVGKKEAPAVPAQPGAVAAAAWSCPFGATSSELLFE
jgi:hypothetical protein